jgi:hypothetical protein
METKKIIAELDAEIEKLQQARALIVGSGAPTAAARTRGRARSSAATKKAPARRQLSPEARKRIAEAQRKRWAAAKKSQGSAARKAPAKAQKRAGRKTARKAAARKAAPAVKQESAATPAS